jgi:hypothetical protein
MLAVGLGIGVALAATPGVASADDIQVSIDGFDLFPTAGNTATATSGMWDIAIAIGNSSFACAGCSANPGQFDFASANGTTSQAITGDGNFDFASATGTNSEASASGELGTLVGNTLGNGDFAYSFGPNAVAAAGAFGAVPSDNDVALAFNPFGSVGPFGCPTTPVICSTAEAGSGNFDFASVFGEHSDAAAGFQGNFDLADAFGNMVIAHAESGSFLVDVPPLPLF